MNAIFSKKTLLVSPYLFTLLLAFLMLISGGGVYLFISLLPVITDLQILLNGGGLAVVALLLSAYAAIIIVCVVHSYEYFGTVILYDNYLELKAPFRKTIRINYGQIVDVGIDYVWLSISKQFWIYISTIAVQPLYVHRINRVPYSSTTIRIQYRPSAYKVLLKTMPQKLNKKLDRLSSTIRLHKLDD